MDEKLLHRAEAHHHRLSGWRGASLPCCSRSPLLSHQDTAPKADDPKKFVKELNDSGPNFDNIDQLLKYIVDGADEWAEVRLPPSWSQLTAQGFVAAGGVSWIFDALIFILYMPSTYVDHLSHSSAH